MPPRYSCFPFNAVHPRPWLKSTAVFHTTAAWRNGTVDHYETLGLRPDASTAAIKKKFYSLSKTHHPDHNRNDPEASRRFVKISEAYAVLGNHTKREIYDRDSQRPLGGPSSSENRGSNSKSGPCGSRPASGLSRRRTQFRGPPPSFYRSGGWGSQEAKRASQAETAASPSSHPAPSSAGSGASNTEDFRDGRSHSDWNNDIPHFDHDGHYRTQQQQEQRRLKRMHNDSLDYDNGGSMLINFVLVGGVISLAYLISTTFDNGRVRNKKKNSS